MNTDNVNETSDTSTTSQVSNEQEVGRYTDRAESVAVTSTSLNVEHTDNNVVEKFSQNAESIAQELDMLYSNINQHIHGKLSEIDKNNQEINQLMVNLNKQLSDALGE